MKRLFLMMVLMLCSFTVSGLQAEQAMSPLQMYESVFGAEEKRVTQTRTRDDDLKLAELMMTALETEGTTKGFRLLVCQRAVALAEKHPEGLPLTLKALDAWATLAPKDSSRIAEKRISTLRRMYFASRGKDRLELGTQYLNALLAAATQALQNDQPDEASTFYRQALPVAGQIDRDQVPVIRTALSAVAAEQLLTSRIERLEQQRKENPDATAIAKELAGLYLDGKNDPKKAATFANQSDNELLKQMLELASKPLEKLDAETAAELAGWFRNRASDAEFPASATLLIRSKMLYDHVAAEANGEGVFALKARIVGPQIDTALADAGLSKQAVAELVAQTAASLKPDGPRPPRIGLPGQLELTAPTGWPADKSALFAWAGGEKAIVGKVKIEKRGDAQLTKEGHLQVKKGALIFHGVNEAILTNIKKSNQLTIEARFQPIKDPQRGPARIVSFSDNSSNRNFTLGQEGHIIVLRLRTPQNGNNGNHKQPNLVKVENASMVHVVLTYADNTLTTYVNGQLKGKNTDISGNFSNWAPMQLLLGNEFKDNRPWSGTITHVAIYNKALDAATVKKTYEAMNAK